ncbi:MAG: NAD-binding protein [Desulfobacterales bacterium]
MLPLGIGEEEIDGVTDAVRFLRAVNAGETVFPGNNITVIGGGNAAIDAARVARRMGCEVTVVYRRAEAQMPAYEDEITGARQEGVRFRLLTTPVKVVTESGRVSGLECLENRLGSGFERPAAAGAH